MVRYRTLDSARGIAAFVVLLHHCFMSLAGGGEDRAAILREGIYAPLGWLYATPLRLAVSGPAAVLLFFVLSGFVLTLSVRSSPRPTPVAFAISRFARIWLPFAFVILCSAALSLLLAGRAVAGASPWFHAQWGQGATPGNLVRHLLMTGTGIDLDSPMWSLIHELRISLLFPLLVFITLRLGYRALVLSVFASLICTYLAGNLAMRGGMASLVSTGIYVYFFVIGILIAVHRDRLQQMLIRAPKFGVPLLWILALAGLGIAPGDTSHIVAFNSELLLLLNGLAAALVILLCTIDGWAAKLLLLRIPLFLGRISYSLYLTHVVVISSLVHALGTQVPLATSILVSIPISLAVADICQRFVERPSQSFGKQMAAAIAATRKATVAA
jgi:peptidoglycan/LPS O-acetylase OafA/YrhL